MSEEIDLKSEDSKVSKDLEGSLKLPENHSNQFKIAAVVVTYNRLELLKICIDSIRKQTRKLDEIIVVNNSSTDGTVEWLNDQKDLTVITQENSGSAGGQYTGIKTAYEKGYDWILTADDDVCFYEDYLQELLVWQSKIGALFLGGVVLSETGRILVNHRGLLYKKRINKEQIQYPIPEVMYTNPLIEVHFISYIGMFINRQLIGECGFPDKSLYLYHDDVEYCLRVTLKKIKAYLITSAHVVHSENYVKISPLEHFKNRQDYQINEERQKLFLLSNRNLFLIVLKYYSFPWKIKIIISLFFIRVRRIVLYEYRKISLIKTLVYAFISAYTLNSATKKHII